MREAFDAILKSLSLTLTPTSPPPAHGGEWFQVLAIFKTRGFARILVSFDDEEALLLIHFAAPGLTEADAGVVASAMQHQATGVWRAMLMDGALAVLGRVSDLNALSAPLASCCRFAEQIEDGAKALSVFADPNISLTPIAEPTSVPSPAPSDFVFESIGDPTPSENPPKPAVDVLSSHESLTVEIRDGSVFARLAVSEEPSSAWPGVRRTLRGMLDVDVELLESTSGHLCFSVRPVDLGGPLMSLDQTGKEVMRVLKTSTIASIPDNTVPLPSPDTAPIPSGVLTPNVVFSLPNDGPLKPRDFDDARLAESDSTAPLVDIVLRHPGYSDRRVGQVLSILLSVEYHRALQLMNASPLVIAHGVAYARAETLKRVVESAGGKIQLTEPGRYPAS